jgi:LysM repeat protein
MLLKKIIPALFICLISVFAFAQNDSKVAEYISKYKEIAIKEMMRTGVPASITLAQGILESQNGESDLAKRSNNHFGIKCKPEWTGDRTYHDDDAKGECFRVYTTVEQSYMDHSDFLKNRPYYTSLFTLDPTDYEAWAKGLKKAGYATSPIYAKQLVDLIERYNLQDYTLVALQRSKEQQNDMLAYAKDEKQETTITPPVVKTVQIDSGNATKDSKTTAVTTQSTELVQSTVEAPKAIPVVLYNAADYPGGPFTINGSKVIFATEGTSLLALANEFGVSYKKLLEFNEMDEQTDILPYDQLIFLAKKSKKGSKDIHVVEKNETLEIISQKEGIQLQALLEYNRIPKGRQAIAGEKIYLKTNSPVTPKLAASN